MPKTLVLMRHAHAASPEGVADHERPLTERGRREAAEAGRRLRALGVPPQAVIVSGATRARETYDALRAELAPPVAVRVTDEAYHASAGELLELVRAAPEDVQSVLVVAHNPGVGMLARMLDDGSSQAGADLSRRGFPTAAVAVFAVDGDWAQLNPGEARFEVFAAPGG